MRARVCRALSLTTWIRLHSQSNSTHSASGISSIGRFGDSSCRNQAPIYVSLQSTNVGTLESPRVTCTRPTSVSCSLSKLLPLVSRPRFTPSFHPLVSHVVRPGLLLLERAVGPTARRSAAKLYHGMHAHGPVAVPLRAIRRHIGQVDWQLCLGLFGLEAAPVLKVGWSRSRDVLQLSGHVSVPSLILIRTQIARQRECAGTHNCGPAVSY